MEKGILPYLYTMIILFPAKNYLALTLDSYIFLEIFKIRVYSLISCWLRICGDESSLRHDSPNSDLSPWWDSEPVAVPSMFYDWGGTGNGLSCTSWLNIHISNICLASALRVCKRNNLPHDFRFPLDQCINKRHWLIFPPEFIVSVLLHNVHTFQEPNLLL